jgi:taurine--2-oxoglutarate transaminase
MTGTDHDRPSADQVRADDTRHVFHSWSAQAGRNALAVAGAEGSWFFDFDGKRYLDLACQLVFTNVGHQHPRIVEAIKEQADRLCTLAPAFANDRRGEAARLIASHAPGDLNTVFFTNGGAEANENAIRMARLHTGRHKILVAYRSYHGATAGAITLTGDPRRWPSEPGVPGVVRFFGPYPYRSAFGATTDEEECARALAHLSEVLMVEGPENVAAILLEPVVGTNGILVPPDGYLAGVRELCDEFGILLISDEVMTGFGRCGEWFAVERWSVTPDLITFAKGVNSGYVPLGGVVISERVAASFAERPYPGGLTYSGHPLACAAAVASIRLLEDEQLVERAARLGDATIGPALVEIAERHEAVGEVRGLGCFFAIELVSDRATREMLVPYNASGPAAAPMAAMAAAARDEGVFLFTHFNRIHVLPPLNISDDDLRYGLGVIDRVLTIADEAAARSR